MNIGTNGANAFRIPPRPTTMWPTAIPMPVIAGMMAGVMAFSHLANPPPVMDVPSRSIRKPIDAEASFTTGESCFSSGPTSFRPRTSGPSTGASRDFPQFW